jgi:uncharacterized protein YukE
MPRAQAWALFVLVLIALCGVQSLQFDHMPVSFVAPVLSLESSEDDIRFRQTESASESSALASAHSSYSTKSKSSQSHHSSGSSSGTSSANPWVAQQSLESGAPAPPKATPAPATPYKLPSDVPSPPSASTDALANPPRPDPYGEHAEEHASFDQVPPIPTDFPTASGGSRGYTQSSQAGELSVSDPLMSSSSSSSSRSSVASASSSRGSSASSLSASSSHHESSHHESSEEDSEESSHHQPRSTSAQSASLSSALTPLTHHSPSYTKALNEALAALAALHLEPLPQSQGQGGPSGNSAAAGPNVGVLVSGENINRIGSQPEQMPLREEQLPEAQNCPNVDAEVALADSDRKAHAALIVNREMRLHGFNMAIELAQQHVNAINQDMISYLEKNRPQADDLELKHFKERYDDAKLDVVKAKLKRDDFFTAAEAEDNLLLQTKFAELPGLTQALQPLEAGMVQARRRWQKESGQYSQDLYQSEYQKLKGLACALMVLRTKTKEIANEQAAFTKALTKKRNDKIELEQRHRLWAAMHARFRTQQKKARLLQLNQIIAELTTSINDKEQSFRQKYQTGSLAARVKVRGAVEEIVRLKKQRQMAADERQQLFKELQMPQSSISERTNAPGYVSSEMSFHESSSHIASQAAKSLSHLESQTITMLSASTAP